MSSAKQNRISAAEQLEQVERASWFARLAFGDFSEVPVPAPRNRESNFNVMP